MTAHIFESHADHVGVRTAYFCRKICDGGLKFCKVCWGAGDCLTTECPGEYAGAARLDQVGRGRLDFRDGTWIDAPWADEGGKLYLQRRRGWSVGIGIPVGFTPTLNPQPPVRFCIVPADMSEKAAFPGEHPLDKEFHIWVQEHLDALVELKILVKRP